MEDLNQKISSFRWSFQPLLPPVLPPLALSLGALPPISAKDLVTNLATFQAAWPSLSPQMSFSPSLTIPSLTAPVFRIAASLQLIKEGLGIDLALPGSEEAIPEAARSFALNNMGMGLSLLPMNLAGILLDLLPIASVVQTVQSFTNELITSTQFPIALESSLTLLGNVRLPLLSLQFNMALKLALAIQQLKLAFGIDLLDPAGVAYMTSRLQAMSRIAWPSLQINLPRLTLLLGILSAGKTIQLALGINPWEPGAGLKIKLALTPFFALSLPKIDLSALALALASLDQVLKINPQEMTNLNLSTFSGGFGNTPNAFAPWGLLAALAINVKANFGLNLLKRAQLDCKAVCPMA